MNKKVLVIGRGGREHAICRKLFNDGIKNIYFAPGNAGTESFCSNVDISETNIIALANFAEKNKIDLTIVGPESSLAEGVVDEFESRNLKIFGPSKKASIIEGSKDFAKKLMVKYNVPTAQYATFCDFDKAVAYVKDGSFPTVIKYDGLAAGKGVVIAKDFAEATDALQDMLVLGRFSGKTNGNTVVIEEFLEGEEFSLMAFVCGDKVYPMAEARDYKRAYDFDKGLNTGGMGAFSPVPYVTKEILDFSTTNILQVVANAMISEGRNFCGILYAGLILTKSGVKVIEFNARFGDPETEVVLPRMDNSLYQVIDDLLVGKNPNLVINNKSVIGVVMASKGYPSSYENGYDIEIPNDTNTNVFHMGTIQDNGNLKSSGGRVLFVCGNGNTLKEARENAYTNVNKIKCDNLYFRTDIGSNFIT